MPNITVTVSESAYRQARIWAATHNTSVSAVVQYCIEHLPAMKVAEKGAAATARRNKQPPERGPHPPVPAEKSGL
jgi:hypothetical protein